MASLDGSMSVVRARRRPARYSPELSSAQQQSQQSDMCIGGLLAAATDTQGQEDNEETNDGEMAPAVKRSKHKPKRRYKKRHQHDESGAKRPRVANVLLENEMLIDEIRVRKALWMRTHEQHHSSALTAPLWEEIAKALDTTQENVRRRWKSLKDHYRRELKKSMTDATAPPSLWPYYKKMRFMKSQMFVSLRRKNGEDHLEILSDDEEDINTQWNNHIARKQEGGSDTMDDYELGDEYHEMVKYEQHMLQHEPQTEINGNREEEEEEEEQQQDEQEEQEQEELSPIPSLQDQENLSALQQQADLSELSNMSTMQQQTVMTTDMSTMTTIAEMVNMPNIVTTTASSLSNRISSMQQHTDLSERLSAIQQQRASDLDETLNAIQQNSRHSTMQQQRDINGGIAEINARHSTLQQQRTEISDRISAIQRNAEISAIQQTANISAMHERAEITAMQQRAEMQQRNGVSNGVENSNVVSPIIGDERGGISDDYHFFMSLMPHVRHFTSLQKLKVRNRIQQIIIEETSNCQYDPLANC